MSFAEIAREILSIAKSFGLIHVAFTYLCSPSLTSGPSMLPTLNNNGDVTLTEHVSHRLGKVRPGDVVVVRSPFDPTLTLAKRIVGMEGAKITFMPDPDVSETCRTITVPKGHVWIQGDNMYDSCDSRHFGPVPYGLIQGKIFLRVWPLDAFGTLER